MKRRARITGLGITQDKIASYLPANYEVVGSEISDGKTYFLIEGTDNAGWTLDDYVLPRLASGLYFGEEVPA